jgi:hypothetical protein
MVLYVHRIVVVVVVVFSWGREEVVKIKFQEFAP